jgi:hypothetical protein
MLIKPILPVIWTRFFQDKTMKSTGYATDMDEVLLSNKDGQISSKPPLNPKPDISGQSNRSDLRHLRYSRRRRLETKD